MRVHVEGCATCREVAGRLRRVVGALPLTADEATPPVRLRSRVLAAASSTARPAAAVPSVVRRPPSSAPPRRGGFARRIPTYALAAVAAVALLLGVIVGQVAFRPTQPQQEQVARFTLAGHQDMAGARATVVDLRSDGLALVDFTGLPAAGAGRVYEVWLIPATGSPVPAAVFVPDANGAKVVLVNRSLSGYAVMAVTNEAGPDGVAAPTQQPQLYGNVA
jgi:anti-sigma-K factor RskA